MQMIVTITAMFVLLASALAVGQDEYVSLVQHSLGWMVGACTASEISPYLDYPACPSMAKLEWFDKKNCVFRCVVKHSAKPTPKHPAKKIAGAVMLEGSTGASNPVRGRLIGESTTKIEAKKAAPKTTSIGPKVRCFSVGTNLDNQWERYPENDANCLDHLKAWRMPGSAELADRLNKSELIATISNPIIIQQRIPEPVDVPAVKHEGTGYAIIPPYWTCSDPSRIGPLQSQDGKWHCLKLN